MYDPTTFWPEGAGITPLAFKSGKQVYVYQMETKTALPMENLRMVIGIIMSSYSWDGFVLPPMDELDGELLDIYEKTNDVSRPSMKRIRSKSSGPGASYRRMYKAFDEESTGFLEILKKF